MIDARTERSESFVQRLHLAELIIDVGDDSGILSRIFQYRVYEILQFLHMRIFEIPHES